MWLTNKETGAHFNTDWFDEKERQIAENKKQADKLNGKLVTAVHFTPSEDNVKSIILYFPPYGIAGLASFFVKTPSLLP